MTLKEMIALCATEEVETYYFNLMTRLIIGYRVPYDIAVHEVELDVKKSDEENLDTFAAAVTERLQQMIDHIRNCKHEIETRTQAGKKLYQDADRGNDR